MCKGLWGCYGVVEGHLGGCGGVMWWLRGCEALGGYWDGWGARGALGYLGGVDVGHWGGQLEGYGGVTGWLRGLWGTEGAVEEQD